MIYHPADHPIAVQFDPDCDGMSIAYFDTEHPEVTRLPYGVARADVYLTREEFENEILTSDIFEDWDRDYWKKVGYASDHSQVVNCEIHTPTFGVPAYRTAV